MCTYCIEILIDQRWFLYDDQEFQTHRAANIKASRLSQANPNARFSVARIYTEQGSSTGISSVGAGRDHTCVVTTSGGAKCWGDNADGELGIGLFGRFYLSPIDVKR